MNDSDELESEDKTDSVEAVEATHTPEELANFRAMWNDLHVYAARSFPDKPTPEQIDEAGEWLLRWAQRLPDNCACRDEWIVLNTIQKPPLAKGRVVFFWWTVAAHDVVNARLGKPLWSNRSKVHELVTGWLAQLPEGDDRIRFRNRVARGSDNKL